MSGADAGAPADLAQQRIVIVGGGLAAATAAVELRAQGHRGTIVMFGAEAHVPYERPGLSKGYLAGNDGVAKLEVVPASWYAEHDVDLRLEAPVTDLDRTARTVTTKAGEVEHYDRLLLATGATPRALPLVDGLEAGIPVCYLRTLDDADRLRTQLRPDRRVVIIGGGFLGLEVAATARGLGADVTLVESRRLPLAGVLGDQVAAQLADVHRDHGVDLRLGTDVTGIRAVDGLAMVELQDRPGVVGDVLVIGIGAVPEVGLAVSAGLDVEDGIVVDQHLRTSDPRILAAGDVARFWHPVLQRFLRVEHWDNARAHGVTAARTLLGLDADHDVLPYFFTDQYDLGMEYFGEVGPDGADEVVVHGELRSRLVAFYARHGVVRAALHVNDWDRGPALRKQVADRIELTRLEAAR